MLFFHPMNAAVKTDMTKECQCCIFIECHVLNMLVFTIPDDSEWPPKHVGRIKKL
jgi:hypothetical protein